MQEEPCVRHMMHLSTMAYKLNHGIELCYINGESQGSRALSGAAKTIITSF